MNNRISLLTFCCLAMLLQLSCKTKQTAVLPMPADTVNDDSFAVMKIQPFNFNTLSLKVNAEVQSGDENNSFSGNIYLVRDSAIWVSVQKFGLEVVRALITNDSVRMLDRINKIYWAGDYSILTGILKTNFDFDGLQSLITGNDTKSYENTGFTEKKVGDTVVYYYAKRKKKTDASTAMAVSQEIWVNQVDSKICKNSIKNISPNSGSATFSYSDFEDFGGQKYPGKIGFMICNASTIEGYIDFMRVTPEKKESLPFTIPESYERKK
ncbi:MAG TPA: DUF4292 domain-containing protein [Bacteroidales bacterium]|nr:DUF4292 domain-containing protein [Bacteroidales bacterium]